MGTTENRLQLRVPVRVTEGIYRFKPLNKKDVNLFINGRPTEIAELVEDESTIARAPGLGRSFILSFQIPEYNNKVAEAVSYFVTDVLYYTDMLFILTPLNAYRVEVSRNKLKMIGDIEALVRKDCETYNTRRLQAEKDLEKEIQRVRWSFQNPYRLSPYFAVLQFLKFYPAELKRFSDEFWLPNIEKYKSVIDFLGLREGERWCIHFQQRGIDAINTQTKLLLQGIKGEFTEITDMGNEIKSNLYSFEIELSRMDSYSAAPLLNPLLHANINFNTLLLGGMEQTDANAGRVGSFFLEKILKQTAVATGGSTIETANPLEGLKEIINHRDHYYEVVFDISGEIEEKKIDITLADSKEKPSSRESFTLEELDALVHYLSKEKVRIEEISTAAREGKGTIAFAIKSFEMRDPLETEKGEKFGILEVQIRLLNEWGEQAYHTERMLRVTEDTVNISHTLPPELHGHFIIHILVTDFLRNGSETYTGEMTLNP